MARSPHIRFPPPLPKRGMIPGRTRREKCRRRRARAAPRYHVLRPRGGPRGPPSVGAASWFWLSPRLGFLQRKGSIMSLRRTRHVLVPVILTLATVLARAGETPDR